VLANVGENVVLRALRDLVEASRTLETATATYATSLSDADRDAARTAFRNTMEAAQRAEVYQLGPAGPMGLVTAGQGLRDEMYAWPLVNRCRADQETVDPAHASIDTLRLEAINVRGLATIEYLLYETTLNNGCPPSININAMGTWAALGDAGVRRNRAEYAHNAAILVRERAEELVRAWESSRTCTPSARPTSAVSLVQTERVSMTSCAVSARPISTCACSKASRARSPHLRRSRALSQRPSWIATSK
jgi:hypothetical protein